MIAHRDAENFLGFILPNDVAIEIRLDVARLFVESERLVVVFVIDAARIRIGRDRFRRRSGKSGKMLAHEFRKLLLKFLRSGRTAAKSPHAANYRASRGERNVI